jgi:phage terminase small subunit
MAILTEKQATFVQEYLIDLNATQAAIRAGFSPGSAARYAVELLNKTHVAEAIKRAMQERNQRVEISQDRILEELARIAFGDLRDAVTWGKEGVKLKESAELTEDQAAAISEVSETSTKEGGSTRIKRHDKVKAIELLMRHKGMLNDKLNLSGELNVSALGKGRERAKERI